MSNQNDTAPSSSGSDNVRHSQLTTGLAGATSGSGKMNQTTNGASPTPFAFWPTPTIAPGMVALLGRPPLLPGESEEHYYSLLSQLACDLKSRTLIEWLMAKDIAELTFDIMRFGNSRIALIAAADRDAVHQIMEIVARHESIADEHGGCYEDAEALVDAWYMYPESRTRILAAMHKYGLGEHSIAGLALSLRCDALERIDRMIATCERRRNAIIQDIAVFRTTVAEALQETIKSVEAPRGEERD